MAASEKLDATATSAINLFKLCLRGLYAPKSLIEFFAVHIDVSSP
jgi:hypothetical protein